MAAKISYGVRSDDTAVDTVIIVGLKDNVVSALAADGALAGNAVLHRMALAGTPGTDHPAVATTTTVEESKGGDTGLVSSSVVLLPTACSRHNSRARPHAITSGVARCAMGSSVEVNLVVATASDAVASVVAVARVFPTFSAKTKATTPRSVYIKVLPADGTIVSDEEMARLGLVGEGARGAAALVDMPTNILHSDAYIAYVKSKIAELPEPTVELQVIQGTDLRDRGFGGLWSVGQAAEHLPALAILTHTPAGGGVEGVPTVAMCGKGIMYDTGGLSIKTKTGMPGMKRDMGGSAGLLHGFLAAAAAGHPQKMHCLLCIAENAVGKNATRPDDIITQYSGKTVEINNTDAEGRIVLGDGVAYATKHLRPDLLIDMATLTGAQGIATGTKHGALYCNSDSLEALAVAAGKASGDLVQPMVYCPEFLRDEFASVVADFKNSVANRGNAQSSCAGQFIGNHIEDAWLAEHAWLHIDMAAPVKKGERATGYGVALVVEILRQMAAKPGANFAP